MSADQSRVLSVHCPWFPKCTGCDDLNLSFAQQKQKKVSQLAALFSIPFPRIPEIQFVQIAPAGLRDRLDFSLQDGALGLFDRERKVVDLLDCAQLSPAFQGWLKDFRKNLPPVPRASIRLRVSPTGERGIWLDLANLDAKKILDEATWLGSLGPVDIEIGQRRKSVKWVDGKPKLKDPELKIWSSTIWRDQTIPLYGVVGGFTQPSHRTNQWITEWFRDHVVEQNFQQIIELGTGNGNLSFPALSGKARLIACENDALAIEGFKRSLSELTTRGFTNLAGRVEFHVGDFLNHSLEAFKSSDLLIANPPRSGLKAFLNPLEESPNLKKILYMSCHAESFAQDLPRLKDHGFEPKEITILDQFPQTRHMEILAVFER